MVTVDVTATSLSHAMTEADASPGGAPVDLHSVFGSVRVPQAGRFDASVPMTREEPAYSLVQALGLQAAAQAHTGDVTVTCDGTSYTSAACADERGVRIASEGECADEE